MRFRRPSFRRLSSRHPKSPREGRTHQQARAIERRRRLWRDSISSRSAWGASLGGLDWLWVGWNVLDSRAGWTTVLPSMLTAVWASIRPLIDAPVRRLTAV